MGPPQNSGGEPGGHRRRVRHADRLQWGRRRTAAERRSAASSRTSTFAASMGPPQNSGGEAFVKMDYYAICRASMGPPQNSGGEARYSAPSTGPLRQLQWGRRRTAAERTLSATDSTVTTHCFNGAAAEQRRRGERAARPQTNLIPASMGPPQNSGGEVVVPNIDVEPTVASMGPPQNSGGEGAARCAPRCARFCFNGAAAEQRRRGVRKNGLLRDLPSFNGAAAEQRRRDLVGGRHATSNAALQWGRRRTAAESRHERFGPTRRARSFNGAAAEQRRRGPARPSPSASPTRLQWGRRRTAAESARRAPPQRGSVRASMGPPQNSGGESLPHQPQGGGRLASMGPLRKSAHRDRQDRRIVITRIGAS